MKNILLFFALLFPFFVSAQEDNQAQKDSLRNVIRTTDGKEKITAYMRLANIYYAEVRHDAQKIDALFALYDELDAEAERQGDNTNRGAVWVNKLQALVGLHQYDEVIKLAPDYLAFLEKKQEWEMYYRLYTPLINTYTEQGNDDEALATAQKMFEHAKANNNNSGMGLAFFNMAKIYSGQRRFTEVEECYRKSIALLQDEKSMLNVLTDAHYQLGICLIAQTRYDEAVQLADEMEDVVKRFEEATGVPQPIAYRQRCAIYLDAYSLSGQYDKAEIYYNELERVTNGKFVDYEMKAYILASHKQYAEALEVINKGIEEASPSFKLQLMGAKMMILSRQANSEEIEQLFRESIELLIDTQNDKMNAQLDEIRTQYEVDKHIAEKNRNRNYFLFALGGCLLLAIALAIWIHHSRAIVKKNRGLYRQIKEQDRLAEELEAMTQQYDQIAQLIPPTAEEEVAVAENVNLPGNQQQRKLVSRLREILLNDNYFANYDIDLQKLTSEIATNRTYLFEALKAVTGKTPMEYITYLRLDEAKRLLDNPTLTIETIALDCGFNTSRTLYRQFRDRYRISPTEYRKMARMEI